MRVAIVTQVRKGKNTKGLDQRMDRVMGSSPCMRGQVKHGSCPDVLRYKACENWYRVFTCDACE